jgi:hypothetical protein
MLLILSLADSAWLGDCQILAIAGPYIAILASLLGRSFARMSNVEGDLDALTAGAAPAAGSPFGLSAFF